MRNDKSMTASAILAVALLAVSAFAIPIFSSQDSDAAISGSYGEVYEIDLAPGFSYSYTPTYPSDLTVTTTIHDYESEGISASMSGSTLNVSVKDGVSSGSYDLILKATSSTGGISQTAYQHIRFNIVSGLTIAPSQVINDIIKGASVNFTPSASSGMGDVTWTVKTGTQLPAGLSFSNGKVTGTPTKVGQNTVSLTATAHGESKDLVVTFTVYNVIVGGSAETIFSNGGTVSSTPITQTGSDLGVTWAVTGGTLPSGFSLNKNTGVVSGSSTTLQEVTVTLTGTAANGPSQTATKQLTIRSEPKVAVSAPSDTVYVAGVQKTLQLSSTSGTSDVTWSVSQKDGVSISQSGVLTVLPSATSGSVTVTAETAYGGTAAKQISIVKESTAAVSGGDILGATAGTPATADFTCNVAGTWSVDDGNVPVGVTVSIDQTGKLTLSGSAPGDSFTVTVQLTTAAGQVAEKEVTCQIVSQLIFNTEPSVGMIAYEV